MTDDEDRIDFTEFLANHDKGTTAQMCGIYLQRVVRACLAHKGGGPAKGKVNLALEIEGSNGRASITAKIDSKEPGCGSMTATYFATEDGKLHDENPAQTKIPARILGDAPIRFPGGQS
jgi:hypothetical protein